MRETSIQCIRILLFLLALIVLCVSCTNNSGDILEREAKEYLMMLLDYDNVEELNGAFCITKRYSGATSAEDFIERGYLFLYNDDSYAYFDSGVYKGDGSNGGAGSGIVSTLYNLHASAAKMEYLEYRLTGIHLITRDEIIDDQIGLFPLVPKAILEL